MAAVELIAIVGPTASGKTALAIAIAERYNGEIICADSRTIYKGMDVGTAKPTVSDQARVPHWGLDLVEPGQQFSAADFKRYADDKITDICSRGKLPLIVGGTGLYVDSVLYDFTFGHKADDILREQLSALSVEELQIYCTKNNVELPENSMNKRHLIRAIELKGASNISKSSLNDKVRIVGIATNMSTLRTRILSRTEHMFAQNIEPEAIMLGKRYGWESEAMTGNIYPLIKKHLDGMCTRDELLQAIVTADYKLAKRQMTWFRRNPDIMWGDLTGAESYLESVLAGE